VERCIVPPGTEWEVILVDNNSTDDTKAVCHSFVEKHPLRFRYLLQKRQGKSFALNTGIANARGAIIAFTDDDITVDPGWLQELLKIFERYDCEGAAGRIIPVWQTPKPTWFSADGPYRLMLAIVQYDHGNQPCQVETPPFGANMAFRKDAFERYGMFRTDLGPSAATTLRGEDSEYCLRVIGAGGRIMYAPESIVYHPVEKERTKKHYFQSWYFDYGRTRVRITGVVKDAPRYCGIPRYMLRQLLAAAWNWMTSIRPKPRFYYRLQMSQTMGEILEARKEAKRSKRSRSGIASA
jgi:GT2 family glycosyltransferase